MKRTPAAVSPARRLLAGGAAAGLAFGVGVGPAGFGAGQSADTASAAAAVGRGHTRPADDSGDSSCTSAEIAQNNVKTDQDGSVPWEIAHAGIGGGAVPPDLTAGSGVRIAIIDTGITAGDPQLSGVVAGGGDFSGSGGDYRADSDGHGTFVASIIAAQQSAANRLVGIAPGARLLIYREAGCGIGKGNTEDYMASAINQAVADHAQIINISQDGFDPSAAVQEAVQNAYAGGVLVVAAAGNYGSSEGTDDAGKSTAVDPVTYPAYYGGNPAGTADLLAVGAVDQNSETAGFSETGNYIGVTAPGVAIVGLSNVSKTLVTDDGTSFAAPYVAAVAAVLLQHDPDLTPKQLMKVLESTATGNGQWDDADGWGEINPQAALQAVQQDPKLDTLTPLYGAGPDADGPAGAATSFGAQAMQPQSPKGASAAQNMQNRGAYLSIGIAGLVLLVALIGSAVTREAKRRGGWRQAG
ncbi:MAG TPA: S8 family serine peptidase [Actinocrinis sp.]|nr:S8 family serine peptidase [Actinocrinis sp.]